MLEGHTEQFIVTSIDVLEYKLTYALMINQVQNLNVEQISVGTDYRVQYPSL